LVLLLTLQAAGVIVRLWASTSSATPTQAAVPPGKRPSDTDSTRALDRFLDHHPLLEEKLRVNPQLVGNTTFLAQNPDLRDFARSSPAATARLSTEPRHLLYRALLRQANVPLPMRELEVFSELFDQEPALERALNENPESIRDPEFLKRQPALHRFLLQRPRLAAVFSTPSVVQKTN
jgi:hypothetical protein